MFPSSRHISDLCPRMQSLYARFDSKMRDAGIDYIVTATYRNNDDQNLAYAKGRTLPGAIITNAKAGQSKHNCTTLDGHPASQAFDIVIMFAGKPEWNIKNPNWKKAGMIGKSVGLEWAGDWTSFQEYPHFQLPKE